MVGVLNTLIDFATLNILVAIWGAAGGFPLVLCNAVAFLVASLNGYFLNKKWTFAEKGDSSLKQYSFYLILTIGGLIINSLMLYLIVSTFPRPTSFSSTLWVNVAKIGATAASMSWNYLVCRYVVFRKRALQ
jgi:putative flippase GtrA